ncbi:MAG: HlyD family secretion protein [Zymomonas mobilis subsp. pomaceae]|uniref:Secretion protein HlyD family protein n=1 Tax=Zymomonas mobilis subsp. pomaceae (strain ATCC 29192 / DSM 22645 / JCM 10191 / CCUG 17912 / NBRC 13757 / NCIMB 11200 / NRRL B-4491 / Barker I) TaxID=579138 RepID=F8EUD3_ZYMMT|nr:HlyD family secretion protein [Zymomonas mobilis]AEI38154.1 secretion protein HlyD family protein [Zymomonas mobilis subsp. pomaceae ATCC 29192]MDX5947843.1 HlyD family secretion protein [Zymomonas mobilis subsp. pomaceae]GEB90049.1 secretion protein [Zymomonas mobilis subsp. pomaceae]
MPYKKPVLTASCAVILLVGLAWSGYRLVSGDGIHQYTNDAYVTADFTIVAPKVSGRIDQVLAEDNEHVPKGEVLAHIEDADYRAALEIARGNVTTAKGDIAHLEAELNRQDAVIASARAVIEGDRAALRFAKQNEARYRNLSIGGAGTIEQRQRAEAQERETLANETRDQANANAAFQQIAVLKAQLQRAQGNLRRAQGEQQQAELNLSYCTIPAPVEGIIGERGVRVGAYVHQGTALLAVVPTQLSYVLANFQETQLTRVKTGQSATVWIDTFPGHPLRAHVDSLAPATGVAFAPIQPDNATGNFTKVVQRIPVKIVFDPHQPMASRVRVGMSVEVAINTGSEADGPHAKDIRYAWH